MKQNKITGLFIINILVMSLFSGFVFAQTNNKIMLSEDGWYVSKDSEDNYYLTFKTVEGLSYENVPFMTPGTHLLIQATEPTSDSHFRTYKGNIFVLTSTSGATHLLKYDSLDATNRQVTFTDLATGTREVSYNEKNQGEIIIAGVAHRFKVNTAPITTQYSLAIDLNGDSIWSGQQVSILTSTNKIINIDELANKIRKLLIVQSQQISQINYPSFFKNSQQPIVLIVGDAAPASDVLAATDVSVALNAQGIKTTAKLASETPDIAQQNSISIGNACNNAITARLFGNPIQCTTAIKEGKGIIKLFVHPTGKITLVLAGIDDLTTRNIAKMVAGWKDTTLYLNQPITYDPQQTTIVPILQPPTSICADSDGGKDPFVRGKTGGAPYSFDKQIGIIWGENPDKCSARMDYNLGYSIHYDCCSDPANNKQLNEAFCENGLVQSTGIQCEYGCSNGVCLKEPQTTTETKCADSDGGENIFVAGETKGVTAIGFRSYRDDCQIANEYFTSGPNAGQPSGSSSIPSCQGKDCFITEYSCKDNQPVIASKGLLIPCPNGCREGACKSTTQSTFDVKEISPFELKDGYYSFGLNFIFNDFFVDGIRVNAQQGVIGGAAHTWYKIPCREGHTLEARFKNPVSGQITTWQRDISGYKCETPTPEIQPTIPEPTVLKGIFSLQGQEFRLFVTMLSTGYPLFIFAGPDSVSKVKAEKVSDVSINYENEKGSYGVYETKWTYKGITYRVQLNTRNKVATISVDTAEDVNVFNTFSLKEIPERVANDEIYTSQMQQYTQRRYYGRCDAKEVIDVKSPAVQCLEKLFDKNKYDYDKDVMRKCDDRVFRQMPEFAGCDDNHMAPLIINCIRQAKPEINKEIDACLQQTRPLPIPPIVPLGTPRATYVSAVLNINEKTSYYDLNGVEYELELEEIGFADNAYQARLEINGEDLKPLRTGQEQFLANGALLHITEVLPDLVRFNIEPLEEVIEVPEGQQICNVPIAPALTAAVRSNPKGICMGGELGTLTIPPAFVDKRGRPIPNLKPQAKFDPITNTLSCSTPCSVPVKETCLKDLGVTTRGANYDENPVDRRQCGEPFAPQPTAGECIGCETNNRCLQFGIRLIAENGQPSYCDLDKTFKAQKQNTENCQNSYECVSNSCGNGQCLDVEGRIQSIEKELKEQRGILQTIVDFFKRMFGG